MEKHTRSEYFKLYRSRVPNLPNTFNNYKIIVNPRLVLNATVPWPAGKCERKAYGRVDHAIARMYHFKTLHTHPTQTLVRDVHLWDYANDSIQAVSKFYRPVDSLRPRL